MFSYILTFWFVNIFRQGSLSSLPIRSSRSSDTLQRHLLLLDGHSLSQIEQWGRVRCRNSKREAEVSILLSIMMWIKCLSIETLYSTLKIGCTIMSNKIYLSLIWDYNYYYRYRVIFNLFILMGISWTAEVVSFILDGSFYFWFFTDLINSLIGFIIFVIFVCKPRIKKLLIQNCPCLKKLFTSVDFVRRRTLLLSYRSSSRTATSSL